MTVTELPIMSSEKSPVRIDENSHLLFGNQ